MLLQTFFIIGYFASWSAYPDMAYSVDQLDPTKLSHVMYAFAVPAETGEVFLPDPEIDYGDTSDGVLKGNLGKLWKLKQQNRHLKTTLSIGGALNSVNFSSIVSLPKRANFILTSINLMNDLGMDGLDLDWEFPKDKTESKFYVTLLRELRFALDLYAKIKHEKEKYLLTVAVPADPEFYKVLFLKEMNKYVDIFNLMTYDFSGEWEQPADHQANLYGDGLSGDQAVMDYIKAGVDPAKITLGVPMYGRSFENTDGAGKNYSDTGEGQWEPGMWDYKSLPKKGSKEFYDKKVVASYSYDKKTREFISYDNPRVVKEKCKYLKNKKLGGIMFWELDGDFPTSHSRSLLRTSFKALGGRKTIDKSLNHLWFPTSKYTNVRGTIMFNLNLTSIPVNVNISVSIN
ncbi:656_t:CDS:2 [Ambispora gerdemannii]|uniref:chitinase n=1 Tax=Ambispora gerdemannii TaxID=144530 RepID=A0A9N9AXG4_9GLOM|nr:656_t:CDS:2 [Ambispora gerdemannii]